MIYLIDNGIENLIVRNRGALTTSYCCTLLYIAYVFLRQDFRSLDFTQYYFRTPEFNHKYVIDAISSK